MEGRKSVNRTAGWTLLGMIALLGAAGWAQVSAAEVAKVNGQALSDRDLRLALSNMNEGMRENVLKDPNTRRQILNALIEQEVLVDEAVKNKMDQDQEYKDALAMFRKQFLASRALQKNLGSKVTDSAAKKYYESNKTKYSTDQVHAMHILLSDEEKAREVLKQAKAPNADFQELAVKFSKDPSVKNNRGDMGPFGRGQFDPDFTDASFKAGKGEIVGPVKTPFGYHIIKIVDKKLGKVLSYEDVEAQVRQDLQQNLRDNYVSKLKAQAKIQVNDAALDKI